MPKTPANVKSILRILNKTYPKPKPFLQFRSPYESLIATILSAQCTDKQVNIVTKKLFLAANTPQKILALGKKKLISFIRSTGFYKSKSKYILSASKKIIKNFGGEVPRTLEDLQKLPGVGRKTASVVLCQAWDIPAFPVDRHVLRVSNRLGLAHADSAEKTDLHLRKNIPKKLWIPTHLQLIMHGRAICRPTPRCKICPLFDYCPYGQSLYRKE